MKIYKLDIDASQPVRKAVAMQKNATGGLKVDVTNNGRTIHNLTTKVYDGDVELQSTDNGFKVDVGSTAKTLKVEATSTPIVSEYEIIESYTPGTRVKTYIFKRLVLPPGIYRQEEFLPILDSFTNKFESWEVANTDVGNTNLLRLNINYDVSSPLVFYKKSGDSLAVMDPDEDIIVTEETAWVYGTAIRGTDLVIVSEPYPAVGEYTNCQIEATITPSGNAPCDGDVEWTEELTDSDGAKNKTEWTTLTIGGVEYTVLAAASEQPKKVEVKAAPEEEVKEEVKPVVEEVKQVDEEVKPADEAK